MSFIDLPGEILLGIASFLFRESDINDLAKTSTRLHSLLNPALYKFNVTHSKSSALLWAASEGQDTTARLCIQQGADPNITDPMNATPLSLAVNHRHPKVVKVLLECKDTDVNTGVDEGDSPLYCAALFGVRDVVKLLLEGARVTVDVKDSSWGEAPLHAAANGGNTEVVKLLLDDPRVDVNVRDSMQYTPLALAAQSGYADTVRLLLDDERVDVNLTDSENRTPLRLAAGKGSAEIVELLLQRPEVDANCACSYETSTPLHEAARSGRVDQVKLLLQHGGVDVSLENSRGLTAQQLAASYEKTAVLSLLLRTSPTDLKQMSS